jgi:hypothetical protein
MCRHLGAARFRDVPTLGFSISSRITPFRQAIASPNE